MIEWNYASQIALECLQKGIQGLSIVTPDVAQRYKDLEGFVKAFGADGSVMRIIFNTCNGGRLLKNDRLRIKIMLPSVSAQAVHVFHHREKKPIWVLIDAMDADKRQYVVRRCHKLFCPPIEVEKRETKNGPCYLLKPNPNKRIRLQKD